jgi:hypothetical protein
MSEQVLTPDSEAPTNVPETNAAVSEADLQQAYDRYEKLYIPDSLEDAQGAVSDLRATSDRLIIKEDSAEIDGNSVNRELASDVKKIADSGIDHWRLNAKDRAFYASAANVEHPSQLTTEQRSLLRQLKPDASMPDSMAMPLLRENASKRLSLDEAIAGEQGKKVAAIREPKGERAARERAEQKAEKEKLTAEEERTKAREEAFERVSAFYEKPERATAAGPDIRKATGLSHQDVLRLGFKSYTELENAAVDWKLEQVAEAERAAKKAAADKREADYQAELQAHRDKRAAAAERVEKLSYAEKLKLGGEFALNRQPGLREKIRENAIAQAEEEGLSVGSMKPSEGYVVPRRSAAAEAETQKTVDALKAFHAGRQLSATESDPEAAAERFTEIANLLEQRRQQLVSEETTDVDDPDDIAEAELIPLEGGDSKKPGAELVLASEADSDIDDTELLLEDGLGARARRMWDRARVRLAAFNAGRPRPLDRLSVMMQNGAQRTGEYFNDDEKGTRRKIIGGALAATLLAGAVYLEASGHGLGFHHHGSNAQEATNGRGGNGGNGNDLPPKHHGLGPETGSTNVESSIQLKQGDTVWGSVNEYAAQHGHHLTEAQTQLITDKVLKANNLNWSSAHNVPVGYQVHFNQQQFDDWLKLTEKK